MPSTKLTPFLVNVTADYWEKNVIPSRCRNPRDVRVDFSMQAQVRTVTVEQAPVAFQVEHYADADQWKDYRILGGKLFEQYLPHAHQSEPSAPGSVYFPAGQHRSMNYDVDTREQAIAKIRSYYKGFFVLDGALWSRLRVDGEPMYAARNFGMGRNHGGSALMTEMWVNENVRFDHYFRADEFEEAKAFALAMAADRGDTESIPRIAARGPQIRVLIPEAVKFKSKAYRDRQRKQRAAE